MGVISDVVIAKKSDGSRLTADINSKEFEYQQMRGLFPDILVVLYAVLANKKISKSLHKQFSLVHAEDENSGPWAYSIPDELVMLLSKVSDKEIPDTAEAWYDKGEGTAVQHFPLEVLEKGLRMLREISKRARRKRKSLFLRICL